MLATRPLLAASLVIPGILVIGYLWQKRRSDEVEENSKSDFSDNAALSATTSTASTVIDSKEVSLKLESLNRSRLDCIEEEEKSEESSEIVDATEVKSDISQLTEVSLKSENTSQVNVAEEVVEIFEEQAAEVATAKVSFQTTSLDSTTVTSSNIVEEAPVEMTTEENVEAGTQGETIPDVMAALKDPIASPLSSSFGDNLTDNLASPIKSEASQKSESWSDLIDEELELGDCNQNVSMVVNRYKETSQEENGRHDSGVASPTEDFSRPETVTTDNGIAEEKARISSGEDAGIGGSETGDVSDGNTDLSDDAQLFSYHFYIQDYLTGTFIGTKGTSIKELKSSCNCNVIVRDDNCVPYMKRGKLKSRDRRYGDGYLNLVILEGTRANIDKCLNTIRERFIKHPELTLEQINKPETNHLALNAGSVALSLVEGIMHDVVVSSIVSGGHIFLQQPTNPTYSALERLDSCMYNTYNQLTCPGLNRPISNNSICVAPSNDGWYRCQIVSYDSEEDSCLVKFVDHGGYEHVPADKLKKIRTDFLSLPFQAIECRLANIVVPEDDSLSTAALFELVSGQVIQARMLGVDEDNIPMVHIYRNFNGQTVMVNRELVDRNCAEWIESKLVSLGDDSSPSYWNILGDFSPSNEINMMHINYLENLQDDCTGYRGQPFVCMPPDNVAHEEEEEDVFYPDPSRPRLCSVEPFEPIPSPLPPPAPIPYDLKSTHFWMNWTQSPFVTPPTTGLLSAPSQERDCPDLEYITESGDDMFFHSSNFKCSH